MEDLRTFDGDILHGRRDLLPFVASTMDPEMNVISKERLPWRVGEPLPPERFREIRRRLILDHCKWDPQVGDVATLAPFPIFLGEEMWNELREKARELSIELLRAEKEICGRPELLKRLGMPRALRKVLEGGEPRSPAALRMMRFDFHYTTDGWKISEVNNDVPGGFTESSSFTELLSESLPGTRACGNPVNAWVRGISEQVTDGMVVLFAAPGYMEDQQVVAFLAKKLRSAGISAQVVTPKQLQWSADVRLNIRGAEVRVDCAVRFYQAEWLPRMQGDWKWFLMGGKTPIVNPGMAVIGESKRLPLLWHELRTAMPTWRELLPETRDPWEVQWPGNDEWLLKTAYCNNGDTVKIQSELNPAARRRLWWG
jgi:glutathionylspermidine synthase